MKLINQNQISVKVISVFIILSFFLQGLPAFAAVGEDPTIEKMESLQPPPVSVGNTIDPDHVAVELPNPNDLTGSPLTKVYWPGDQGEFKEDYELTWDRKIAGHIRLILDDLINTFGLEKAESFYNRGMIKLTWLNKHSVKVTFADGVEFPAGVNLTDPLGSNDLPNEMTYQIINEVSRYLICQAGALCQPNITYQLVSATFKNGKNQDVVVTYQNNLVQNVKVYDPNYRDVVCIQAPCYGPLAKEINYLYGIAVPIDGQGGGMKKFATITYHDRSQGDVQSREVEFGYDGKIETITEKDKNGNVIAVNKFEELNVCMAMNCPYRAVAIYRTDASGNLLSTITLSFFRNGKTLMTVTLPNGAVVNRGFRPMPTLERVLNLVGRIEKRHELETLRWRLLERVNQVIANVRERINQLQKQLEAFRPGVEEDREKLVKEFGDIVRNMRAIMNDPALSDETRNSLKRFVVSVYQYLDRDNSDGFHQQLDTFIDDSLAWLQTLLNVEVSYLDRLVAYQDQVKGAKTKKELEHLAQNFPAPPPALSPPYLIDPRENARELVKRGEKLYQEAKAEINQYPNQQQIKLAKQDLMNTFGFGKEQLEALIKKGLIRFVVHQNNIKVNGSPLRLGASLTVIIDPSVKLPAGAVNLTDPLGTGELPRELNYQFMHDPDLILCVKGGSCNPSGTFQLISATFKNSQGQDVVVGYKNNQIDNVKVYDPNYQDVVCIQAPCYGRLVKEINLDITYAVDQKSAAEIIYHDGSQGEVAIRFVAFFVTTGQIVYVEEYDKNRELIATSTFNYGVTYPGGVSFLDTIDRTDGDGNPLSILFDINPYGNPDGATIVTFPDRIKRRLNFVSFEDLLNQARETEQDHQRQIEVLKQGLINTFGFTKEKLEALMNEGLIKFEWEYFESGKVLEPGLRVFLRGGVRVRVTIDPSVGYRFPGVINLTDPLGSNGPLPHSITFTLGQIRYAIKCAEGFICNPPAPSYYLNSAQFTNEKGQMVEIDYSGNQVRAVRTYLPAVVTHPDREAQRILIKEIKYDFDIVVTHSIPGSIYVTHFARITYHDGSQGDVASRLVIFGGNNSSLNLSDVSYISEVTEYDKGGKVMARNTWVENRCEPGQMCLLYYIEPHIRRVDANGNLLSKVYLNRFVWWIDDVLEQSDRFKVPDIELGRIQVITIELPDGTLSRHKLVDPTVEDILNLARKVEQEGGVEQKLTKPEIGGVIVDIAKEIPANENPLVTEIERTNEIIQTKDKVLEKVDLSKIKSWLPAPKENNLELNFDVDRYKEMLAGGTLNKKKEPQAAPVKIVKKKREENNMQPLLPVVSTLKTKPQVGGSLFAVITKKLD